MLLRCRVFLETETRYAETRCRLATCGEKLRERYTNRSSEVKKEREGDKEGGEREKRGDGETKEIRHRRRKAYYNHKCR